MDLDKTNNKSTQKVHIFCKKKAEKHLIIKKVNKISTAQKHLSLLLLLQAQKESKQGRKKCKTPGIF